MKHRLFWAAAIVDGLGHMTPRPPLNDFVYLRFGHLVLNGKMRWGFAYKKSPSNITNLLFGKPCVGMPFSAQDILVCSALHSHVVHVLGMCANEQMLRIDAQAIVTTMANTQVVRNHTMMNFIRETMGIPMSSGRTQKAIPSRLFVARPKPARSSHDRMNRPIPIDTLPETFGEWATGTGVMQLPKPSRKPLLSASLCVGVCCARGFLSATTLAFAIGIQQPMLGNPGGVLLEIIRKVGSWGRMVHVGSLLSTISQTAGCFRTAAVSLLVSQMKYSTDGLIEQASRGTVSI